MDFALLPPEVNSGLMYTGPGSGPMLAAAASWDAVAAQLEAAAAGCSAEIAGLTGRWLGPSAARMAAAGTRQVAWLQASAAQAARTAAQAYSAAAAYEAAYAMTVPPPVIAANRAQLMVLVATNFFGQNTPAIAATEAQYMEMWVQDAAAMYGYAATTETVSALEPFDEPPQTTNPDGQADQATAVARSAADATSARTQSAVQLATNNAAQLTSTNLPPGDTVTVPAGTNVTVGPGSVAWVNSGSIEVPQSSGAMVGTYSSIVVHAGSSFTLDQFSSGNAYAGSVVYLPGQTITAGANPIELTPAAGEFIQGSIASGSVSATGDPAVGFGWVSTLANAVTGTVGPGEASITNVIGTVTIVTPVTPIATPSGGLVAASAAAPTAASPGLAGTAGIQPQFDVGALMEWGPGIDGADLAAGLAEAG
ncbi:hypothetical protein AWC05_02335 [Mycobacterium florentinum]|uniref:PPE domain-containing protein n=1 Tax=Mycobacterium florentinum TaxID=292462 RepID=A0A1X1TY82_MYCFL|nr:PPE family protein [Mycobacterium florentinum]MCV7410780.1 PPE family protein [Mycobacterium florentinum]ORV49533.1 hypothetical protein AWC05_02335 [Mycobacterium florentinum]BBX80111.1 ribulose-phosphate 3-epimerase [Mycobacterium florentinum]